MTAREFLKALKRIQRHAIVLVDQLFHHRFILDVNIVVSGVHLHHVDPRALVIGGAVSAVGDGEELNLLQRVVKGLSGLQKRGHDFIQLFRRGIAVDQRDLHRALVGAPDSA